ncbi:MAG TPA: response regulator, partial [Flavobacterium sp.]|nr:response regulator [Flavobacterium sp.]
MNTKLKCLLLDDELPGLAYLKMLCGQIPELEIIKAFNDPEKLLAAIPMLDFDLLISDIEMPGIDGLSLANSLKGKLIIFATAYKDYAADAFDMDAVDYITKPIKLERLQKAVLKASER